MKKLALILLVFIVSNFALADICPFMDAETAKKAEVILKKVQENGELYLEKSPYDDKYDAQPIDALNVVISENTAFIFVNGVGGVVPSDLGYIYVKGSGENNIVHENETYTRLSDLIECNK